MKKRSKAYWPSWRYGPDGQAAIFETPDAVPDGWADHPDKVGQEPSPVQQPPPKQARRAPKKTAATLDDLGVSREEALATLLRDGVALGAGASDEEVARALVETYGDDAG